MHANEKGQYHTHATLQQIRIQHTMGKGHRSEAQIHKPMWVLLLKYL